MKKILLLALACALAPLAGRAQTTVSGNLKDVGVANASGSNTYVRFTLIDYGAQIPKITNLSGNLIFNPIKDFKPDAGGIISGTIQGNDTITPPATKYQVCVYYQGAVFRCNTYIINGPTFNLNTATPLNTSVQAGANQLVVLSYPFTQATPAGTWTIPHNFNDPNSYVQVFDMVHRIIYPDRVDTSDPNNAVLTFVTPTAGFAVAMHAGAINIATNQPNAVVSNPVASQTIAGAPLSISAPVTFSGANSHSGSEKFTGPLLPRSIDTVTFFAASLIPSIGLCGISAADASAAIQCAINLLPASGGVVNALALQDVSGTGSTIIDPGAKSVTLLLGPYTYQIQQLVLETDFHVIGTGMGAALGTGAQPTVLQACSTCAATNTVVLGTNGGNGGPIQHALIEGLRIYGATSDTAIGMNLKTVNGALTGIWYSTFRNICVGACGPTGPSANGFSGGAITLDATGANTINQFLDFYNVQAWKTNGGSPALSILGTNGQINFTQCEFDGTTPNDGTTVVQIANSSGNQGPYSITFIGATVQHGTAGVNIAGAFNITFIGTHFELVGGAIQVNSGVGGDIGGGITFIGSTCQNFCGNNSGSGFFAKTTTPNAISVKFIGNQIQNTADAIYVGFANTSQFTSIGDESDSATGTIQLANVGNNFPLLTAFTTTTATSETVAVPGASSSSHCWAQATNATAAALTGVFLSSPVANAVTLNHSATSGGTFNISCTPN